MLAQLCYLLPIRQAVLAKLKNLDIHKQTVPCNSNSTEIIPNNSGASQHLHSEQYGADDNEFVL